MLHTDAQRQKRFFHFKIATQIKVLVFDNFLKSLPRRVSFPLLVYSQHVCSFYCILSPKVKLLQVSISMTFQIKRQRFVCQFELAVTVHCQCNIEHCHIRRATLTAILQYSHHCSTPTTSEILCWPCVRNSYQPIALINCTKTRGTFGTVPRHRTAHRCIQASMLYYVVVASVI